MKIDIRLPIGLMFSLFGLMLAAFGVFGNKAIYERSLGININLIWGSSLIVFAAIMLFLGWRGAAKSRAERDAGTADKSRAH